MKILVLELARLGDIYQTWPALRAFQRVNAKAEIHIITRQKFQVALDGIGIPHKAITLPTVDFISPLVVEDFDVKKAFAAFNQFVDQLIAEKYDKVVNFSFSPFSSFLTHSLARAGAEVIGYSRHADGFLSIPDDMSAYFYAQVGLGRSNRFHLSEVFGTMLGVDLIPIDWRPPIIDGQIPASLTGKKFVALHIGASESHKNISTSKWASIISSLQKNHKDMSIVLLGSSNEAAKASAIQDSVSQAEVINLVGHTSLKDVFHILKSAQVLVAPDSSLVHMASLNGTPTLNISIGGVNFWETGPRAKGSFVIKGNDEDDLASDEIAAVVSKMLNSEKQDLSVYPVIEGTPSYRVLCSKEAEFQWQILKAIYLGGEWPEAVNDLFAHGLEKLQDINQLMISQIESVQKGLSLERVSAIIQRGEEVIETIGKLVPSLAILVRWYQTEKIRLGPDNQENLVQKTLHIHQTLNQVCEIYLGPQVAATKGVQP